MKQFLCCVLLIMISGCHTKLVKINENNPLPEKDVAVYFIGDNQFHLPDCLPYPLENYPSDKVKGVAIRPPQTTIFGPLVFESFLKAIDQKPLLVHLGDAADISCPQEINRFFQIMRSSYRGTWLFTPGNHDGFYTGNSQHKSHHKKTWDNACLGKRLDKTDVIISYLANRFGIIISREEANSDETHTGTWTENEYSVEYVYKIYPDPDKAQKSFIAQKVVFKKNNIPITIIMVDTSQYFKPPKYRHFLSSSSHLAGATGEMLDEQLDEIEKWLKATPSDNQIIYLVGHHPLNELASVKRLQEFINEYNVKGYVSAHTHVGGVRQIAEGKREWNIASFVDWPIGLSTLSVNKNNSETYITEILYDREKTPPGIDDVCAKVECDWKYPYNDFSSYTTYRNYKSSGPTGRHIQHYLLIAELELIVDTLKNFSPDENMTSFIKDKEVVIEEAKALFDKRVKTKSIDEIMALRFHVNCAEKKLREFHDFADGNLKERLNKYFWCQFWWAAKEDAQRQWDIIDATGQRPEW